MVIFEGYGIEVIAKNNKYYLKYDAGEIVAKYVEIEITKEEAERAQRGPQNATEIINYYYNKRMGLI